MSEQGGAAGRDHCRQSQQRGSPSTTESCSQHTTNIQVTVCNLVQPHRHTLLDCARLVLISCIQAIPSKHGTVTAEVLMLRCTRTK